MRSAAFAALFCVPAALCATLPANVLQDRQVDCSAYGTYPEYTGSHTNTNCGASGRNCAASSQRCTIYPAYGCPAQGYTCSSL